MNASHHADARYFNTVTLSTGVLCRLEVTGVIESIPNEIKQSTDIGGPQQELVY